MKEYIFLGDSITDCDHIYDPDGLGNGYVHFIADKLVSNQNRILNLGYDGFTISALKRLWNAKISSLNPSCITILIGINDIALIKNTGLNPSSALENFQMNYEMLIEIIRQKTHCPIILIEPFIFSRPAEYLTWKAEVQKMSEIIQRIAQKYQLHFLSVKSELNDISFTTDGIHLTSEGHFVLANLWMNLTKNLEII